MPGLLHDGEAGKRRIDSTSEEAPSVEHSPIAAIVPVAVARHADVDGHCAIQVVGQVEGARISLRGALLRRDQHGLLKQGVGDTETTLTLSRRIHGGPSEHPEMTLKPGR